MIFRITEPIGFESFGPQHIDLTNRTVETGTFTTDMAMWNYSRDVWTECQSVLAALPLRHPLWRIDESAGSTVWAVATNSPPPSAPLPDFDVLLASIDA
jgi:hypothetical protein